MSDAISNPIAHAWQLVGLVPLAAQTDGEELAHGPLIVPPPAHSPSRRSYQPRPGPGTAATSAFRRLRADRARPDLTACGPIRRLVGPGSRPEPAHARMRCHVVEPGIEVH